MGLKLARYSSWKVLTVLCLWLISAAANGAEKTRPMRTWISADKKFRIVAKLSEIQEESVVLEKEDGNRITVPLAKLSKGDQGYVARQAAAANPKNTGDAQPAADPVPKDDDAPTGEAAPATGAKPAWVRPRVGAALMTEVRRDVERSQQQESVEFRQLAALPKQDRPVVAMALSADASLLVTCTDDGECSLWKMPAAELDYKLEKLEGNEFDVAMSADGRYVAVGGTFRGFFMHDTKLRKNLRVRDCAEPGATCIRISDDSRWVTIVQRDHKAAVRYPIQPGRLDEFKDAKGGVWPYAAAADASYIISGCASAPAVLVSTFPEKKDPFEQPKSAPPGLTQTIGIVPQWMCASRRLLAGVSARSELRITQIAKPLPDGSGPTNLRQRMSISRLAEVAAMDFTPDEQFLVLVDLQGRVEVREVETGASELLKIPVKDSRRVALSRTGRYVAFADGAGGVSCWEVRALPVNPNGAFTRLVKSYLRDKKYDHLEAVGKLFEDDRELFPWMNGAPKYSALLSKIACEPLLEPEMKDYGKVLDAWLKARPNSAVARLLQAHRYVGLGWDARGTGFAGTVTEEGWKTLREQFEKAEAIVVPMADSEDCPPQTYFLLFELAKVQGWEPERIEPYIGAVKRRAAWYYPAHLPIVEMLMPRWHGDAGDAEEYARKLADHVGGAQGDSLYAHLAFRINRYYAPREFFDVEKFDYARILAGLREQLRQIPDSAYVLHETMRMAYLAGDRKAARECWDRLQQLESSWAEGTMSQEQFTALRTWLDAN